MYAATAKHKSRHVDAFHACRYCVMHVLACMHASRARMHACMHRRYCACMHPVHACMHACIAATVHAWVYCATHMHPATAQHTCKHVMTVHQSHYSKQKMHSYIYCVCMPPLLVFRRAAAHRYLACLHLLSLQLVLMVGIIIVIKIRLNGFQERWPIVQ